MTTQGPRSLRINVSWTLVSNVVYGIYQWALIAFLAKISGASAVGAFSLAMAVIVPVQMFFNLQLRALQASDATGAYSFSTYIAVRIGGILCTAILVIGMLLTGIVPPSIMAAIVGVLAVKSVESLSDIVYGFFQRLERLDLSSRSRLIESFVGAIVFGSVYGLTRSILIAMVCISAGLIVVLLVVTLPALRRILPEGTRLLDESLSMDAVRGLLMLGLPMGITMALLSINGALPRFALQRFADTSQVGVYAGFMQLITSGIIITGALGQSVTPRLSQLFHRQEFRPFQVMVYKLMVSGMLMGLSGTIVAWLAGDAVVRLIYSDEFAQYQSALIVTAFGSVFLFAASFQGYALTAARVIRPQMVIFVIVCLSTAISLIWLVPRFGLIGAAWATVIASLVQLVSSSVFLRVRVRERLLQSVKET